MTREQLDALEALAEKATPGPWELECPIDDDNPWIVEAGKPTYEWRCLAMVTKSGDGINATEGSANGDLVIGLRNNATELLAAARRALELEEHIKTARAQGRREGLEEAAGIAEMGGRDNLAKIIGNVIAADIRARINQEPTV